MLRRGVMQLKTNEVTSRGLSQKNLGNRCSIQLSYGAVCCYLYDFTLLLRLRIRRDSRI
jgi:hypothetical protein